MIALVREPEFVLWLPDSRALNLNQPVKYTEKTYTSYISNTLCMMLISLYFF